MKTTDEDLRLAIEDLKFDAQGLIPAIVQDAYTREVLTLAYMNEESLRRTLSEGETWFWSRSRASLWHKGETSGNTQRVLRVTADCDGDALTVLVEPKGPACHTGARSCFHRQVEGREDNERGETIEPRELGELLKQLYALILSRRKERPEGSYTTYLFNKGLDKILKKVGEESAETIIAAKNEEPLMLVAEVSDLIYHLLVLLVERGVALEDVAAELARRGGERSKE
ncbi:MAG: phosphoribosyl-AMP cyclohydrolase / phosphoribosyl-ATP pyrophosphohydrolase [Acidobacteriota bacterium]|jgi:phosphoribosyl-ATP pyrophosphohydrolase/phosphoribosyl-AMP cyclohydrolase|nr:phosphoribosyl-AMP cyclohydrolase / phosphoribosyl-ATP pyrophosphohydrolase [Acidobacteriota bacterium]